MLSWMVEVLNEAILRRDLWAGEVDDLEGDASAGWEKRALDRAPYPTLDTARFDDTLYKMVQKLTVYATPHLDWRSWELLNEERILRRAAEQADQSGMEK